MMYKGLLIAVFVMTYMTTFSQRTADAYREYLEIETKGTTDLQHKTDLLFDLFTVTLPLDRKRTLQIRNEVVSLGEKSGNSSIQLKGALLSSRLLTSQNKYDSARLILDSFIANMEEWDDLEQARIWQAVANSYYWPDNIDSSIFYLERALSVAPNEPIHLIADLYTKLSTVYRQQGNLDKSLELLERIDEQLDSALHYDSTYQVLFKKGIVAYSAGIIHYYKGNYQKDLEWLLQAMPIFEEVGDLRRQGASLHHLGTVYRNIKNPEKAIEYFRQSLDIDQKRGDDEGVAVCQESLGLAYGDMEDFETSYEYYHLALDSYQKLGKTDRKANIYNNIGTNYYVQEDFAEAAIWYKRSFELRGGLQMANRIDLGSSLINMGSTFLEAGDYIQARRYLESGLEVAQETKMLQQQKSATEMLGSLFGRVGAYKKSSEFWKENNRIKDSLYSVQSQRSIAEMQEKYDSERKENELRENEVRIQLLEKERQIVRSNNAILVGGLVLFAIIGVLLYKRQQTQKTLVKTELELAAQREQHLRGDLQYKNQELVNFALQISARDEFLESINKEIDKLTRNGLSGNEKLMQLSKQLKLNLSLSKHRKEFEAHVNSVCESFFIHLDALHSNLTENEKRLAALLRLNLTSKEIASVLNISAKSVDMNRYRLRKKLNLSSDENLYQALRSI
ncbi:MAG: tetratricopeptide repeat protein [Cyclobacteriaceae bacterium]|nr:tetratricopeptide repeat protein [Cyclobacteriaceae bacterium HetDA_MAG_MS6]